MDAEALCALLDAVGGDANGGPRSAPPRLLLVGDSLTYQLFEAWEARLRHGVALARAAGDAPAAARLVECSRRVGFDLSTNQLFAIGGEAGAEEEARVCQRALQPLRGGCAATLCNL